MTWLSWVVPIPVAIVASFATMLVVRPRLVCSKCPAPSRLYRTIWIAPLGRTDSLADLNTAYERHRRAWHWAEDGAR